MREEQAKSRFNTRQHCVSTLPQASARDPAPTDSPIVQYFDTVLNRVRVTRWPPIFLPGSPHVILIESRRALISYQGYHMLLLTLAGNWTLYLAANERAQAAVMGVNANGEIVDVVARPAAAAA